MASSSGPRLKASDGPPVVLFPSLAGSVLEVHESPVWERGDRVWMALGALTANSKLGDVVKDSDTSEHVVTNQFVQHMALNPHSNGEDRPGFAIRAKDGLAGCEYLSEDLLAKGGSNIMGSIADMLRKHGQYKEWDGSHGSMIGATYDWRILPEHMERRDGFFTKTMHQLEAMVAADPNHRPAVVIGFSLGCKIGKYFLHFCHAAKGREWVDAHVGHFVPLGGPFRGAVTLMRAMMVDGAFPPLDLMFSESDMLTIMRGAPVGRYLQPCGSWEDGLNLPFCYVRHEKYVKIGFGPFETDSSHPEVSSLDIYKLRCKVDPLGTIIEPQQPMDFHREHPFVETVTLVLQGDHSEELYFGFELHDTRAVKDSLEGFVRYTLPVKQCERNLELDLLDWRTGSARGRLSVRVEVTDSQTMGEVDSKWLPERGRRTGEEPHPLTAHEGGKRCRYEYNSTSCCPGWCCPNAEMWDPAWGLQLQNYDGLYRHGAEAWQVPSPEGPTSDLGPPPVQTVTAIYGVNIETPRCIFLRHRPDHYDGGRIGKVQGRMMLDTDGDVDGLRVIDGIGYETHTGIQYRPDSGEQVHLSGDGTVNYQSLRWPKTWDSETCHVTCFELPGCDHRGISSDERCMHLIRDILDIGECADEDEEAGQVGEVADGDIEGWMQGRYRRCVDFWTRTPLCTCVAKAGLRWFGRYRGSLKGLMQAQPKP